MQDQINQDLKAAMLEGKKEKVETLKMVKTALQMAAIEVGGELSDEDAIKIVKKESKKRTESAEMFEKGGNAEKAEHERREKEVIDTYLPEQMSEDQIVAIVDEVLSSMDNPDMGRVMGSVMQKVAGQADGGLVSKVVKEKLV